MAKAKERMILGAGDLYLTEYTGTIPEHEVIEAEDNLIGGIQSGATLEYSIETTELKAVYNYLVKEIITNEDAVFKTGIMAINGNNIKKLCSTARVSENASKHTRTVKIGGIQNDDGKNYVVRFVHRDAEDGDIRVTIVGKNRAGLTFTFMKDTAMTIDAEIRAIPHDKDGTLITYEETDTTIVA